jgi:hypothetical protein
MPGVLTNRTRVTTTVRLGEAQLDAGADHERRSVVEPSPFWSSVPYDISVLPLEATIKQWVSSSPSLNRSLELEITFCVRGVLGPPCGVPSSTGLTSPFSITPDSRNARINLSILLSLTRRAIAAISLSGLTRSKNFSKSRSTTQRLPAAIYCCALATA